MLFATLIFAGCGGNGDTSGEGKVVSIKDHLGLVDSLGNTNPPDNAGNMEEGNLAQKLKYSPKTRPVVKLRKINNLNH
ncbi:MAG: hypothetical protein O2829_09255 [Bacteroidetes bacterium]|nr:hypothetical protein [Bacteroidota bacterium]MDA1269261.1 hypothetical protein [Bacteroidota bacterium]